MTVGDGALPAPLDGFAIHGARPGTPVTVGLRPENLRLDAQGPLAGRVTRLEYLGSKSIVTVALSGAHSARAVIPTQDGRATLDQKIALAFDPARAHLFDAATGARLDAALVLHPAVTQIAAP